MNILYRCLYQWPSRHQQVAGIITTAIALIIINGPVYANNPQLNLFIVPLECTVETIVDGINTITYLSPEECHELLNPPASEEPDNSQPTSRSQQTDNTSAGQSLQDATDPRVLKKLESLQPAAGAADLLNSRIIEATDELAPPVIDSPPPPNYYRWLSILGLMALGSLGIAWWRQKHKNKLYPTQTSS